MNFGLFVAFALPTDVIAFGLQQLLMSAPADHWQSSELIVAAEASIDQALSCASFQRSHFIVNSSFLWLSFSFKIFELFSTIPFSLISISGSASQLIVHSSRVRTPKRHNSESVLYLNEDSTNHIASDGVKQSSIELAELRSSRTNHRLFPVSTYVESMITKENGGPLKWVNIFDIFGDDLLTKFSLHTDHHKVIIGNR